jgi:hypothetical protein
MFLDWLLASFHHLAVFSLAGSCRPRCFSPAGASAIAAMMPNQASTRASLGAVRSSIARYGPTIGGVIAGWIGWGIGASRRSTHHPAISLRCSIRSSKRRFAFVTRRKAASGLSRAKWRAPSAAAAACSRSPSSTSRSPAGYGDSRPEPARAALRSHRSLRAGQSRCRMGDVTEPVRPIFWRGSRRHGRRGNRRWPRRHRRLSRSPCPGPTRGFHVREQVGPYADATKRKTL